MDIRNPKKLFDDQLDRALRGESVDHSGLLQEEIEILHMVNAIKKAEPKAEPAEVFHQNLRKRLLNTHDLLHNPAKAPVTEEAGNLLTAGNEALLPRPRRWAWAVAPIAAVAVLAAYVSFAAASPGFYEKYVPQPVKKVLEDTKVVQTGGLQVTSDPAGASVLLNNQAQGKTPTEIGGVRVGTHQVVVRLSGYQEERRDVEIKAEEVAKLEISLLPSGNDVQPTPTPSDITGQADQAVLVNQSNDGAIVQIGSTAGGEMANVFKIQPAVEQIISTDAGIIFFSQKSAVGTTIYRLEPGGELQPVVTSATGLAEKFVVSADAAAVSYVTAVPGGYEIHLAKVGGTDQIIYNSPSPAWLPLGIKGDEVVLAQTGLDRRTVEKIITAKSGAAEPPEWVLPAGANTLLDSLTAYRPGEETVLLQSDGKIVAVQPNSSQAHEVFTGEASTVAWAGSRALIVSGPKIRLVDMSQGQTKEIYHAPGDLNVKKAVSDRQGQIVVARLADDRVEAIQVADQSVQPIKRNRAIADCLAVVAPDTFVASDKVISTETPEIVKEISKVGELNLGAASHEALATLGNNIVQVSSGETSLKVISLIDSGQPKVIGSLPPANFSGDLMVATTSRYAIVTGGQLQFIDLQNPRLPQVISTETVPAIGVATSGDKAYVLAGGKLLVYDLAPAKPQKIGAGELDISQALSLVVKNDRLFIAAGDEGLVVVDVTNGAAPKVLQRSRDSFVRGVAPAGKYMYVFTGTPGGAGQAEAWDIVKPAKIKTISPSFALGQVFGDGRYLYAAAPKLAVYEPLAGGAVRVVNEAEANELKTGETQVVAPSSNLATLTGGKLNIYQIQK